MKLRHLTLALALTAGVAACSPKSDEGAQGAPAADAGGPVTVTIHAITAEGVGEAIGTIALSDTAGGLQLVPDLHNLPPGPHGFHVHQNGSCDPGEKDGQNVAGLAAGGHYDPDNTGKHEGPDGNGHKGDLPLLMVAQNGDASLTMVAPHLKVADVLGRAIMIHDGGDNYSDDPKPLGGGGARIACGVVPKS